MIFMEVWRYISPCDCWGLAPKAKGEEVCAGGRSDLGWAPNWKGDALVWGLLVPGVLFAPNVKPGFGNPLEADGIPNLTGGPEGLDPAKLKAGFSTEVDEGSDSFLLPSLTACCNGWFDFWVDPNWKVGRALVVSRELELLDWFVLTALATEALGLDSLETGAPKLKAGFEPVDVRLLWNGFTFGVALTLLCKGSLSLAPNWKPRPLLWFVASAAVLTTVWSFFSTMPAPPASVAAPVPDSLSVSSVVLDAPKVKVVLFLFLPSSLLSPNLKPMFKGAELSATFELSPRSLGGWKESPPPNVSLSLTDPNEKPPELETASELVAPDNWLDVPPIDPKLTPGGSLKPTDGFPLSVGVVPTSILKPPFPRVVPEDKNEGMLPAILNPCVDVALSDEVLLPNLKDDARRNGWWGYMRDIIREDIYILCIHLL